MYTFDYFLIRRIYMKVKEFIQKLNDIGYNDDTEIVFEIKNEDIAILDETYSDCYCKSITSLIPFTLNEIIVEISKEYK
jgi:hypothetical protein